MESEGKSEFQLFIDVSIGTIDEQLVVHLKRTEPVGGSQKSVHADPELLPHARLQSANPVRPKVHAVQGASHGHKNAMLVDVVQLMEQPLGIVAALARVKAVDCSHSIRTHTFRLSRPL